MSRRARRGYNCAQCGAGTPFRRLVRTSLGAWCPTCFSKLSPTLQAHLSAPKEPRGDLEQSTTQSDIT